MSDDQQQKTTAAPADNTVPTIVANDISATDGIVQSAKLSKSAKRKLKQQQAKANGNEASVASAGDGNINTTKITDASAVISGGSGLVDGAGEVIALQDGDNNAADVDAKAISMNDLRVAMEAFTLYRPAKTAEEALSKAYEFWNTQPVPKMDEKISVNEPIEADKTIPEIRAEPYSLPDGFQWDTLNLDEPLVLKELYTLLNENYVEDDDCMFRFDYQPEFLKWALQPTGWRSVWHCGVRVTKSKRLVGFISAIPATINIYSKTQKMVEINFLCVHKKLRSKRVAPVLIREITRRVHLTGCFQAVYTAGIVLPKPVGFCSYWHRSLNPKKLIEVKFSSLSRNMTMQRTLKLYKLADRPRTPGWRRMTLADVPQAHKLLKNYLKKFDLAPDFSVAEFEHWFLPRPNIVDSFIVEDSPGGTITDFVSYYTLPSTVMHHPVHKSLKAAYSFYNVSGKTPWIDLMNDALISAKQLHFDVFNALDLMDNREFLDELKFRIGDGNLQYYLYNWRCPSIQPPKIGLVLQ